MSDSNTSDQKVSQSQGSEGVKRGNAPAETLWDGSLKVAIFRNERENRVIYSLEPGRIYTGKDDRIHETKSLSGAEPLRMAKLLEKGYERIHEFKQAMKAGERSAEQER